ncbi:Fpg/Nei family DNA glycosylase [Propionicicella superfundia]|uniref:Fpg/Nei family DNA glycosylase n=1 Tax=Propionicicella superfundia TaxID=348582 RepID=UPI000405C990|nr:DNA-formamidopyrimidine glycosylase family protein [Propionicicella superfundia]
MPELPEVESLRRVLVERALGRCVVRADLVAFSVLKTVDPPLTALLGLELTDAIRRGKHLAVGTDGLWLAFHLARAGWLQWRPQQPATVPRPGRGPLALRIALDDGGGFDLTEAGTQRKLAVHVVRSLDDVDRIRTLGPDPLDDSFTVDDLARVLAAAGRAQLKGVLKDQRALAGIGNAYSDEILHAARLSPFKAADSLTDEQTREVYTATRSLLTAAIETASGLGPEKLKAEKKASMRVHGREGEACGVCGATILSVHYADSSLQYCPVCQTGGKPLADRRMSRLLK